MKVAAVIGARPQFIKAAAVARAFRETAGLEHVLIHTGQHYDPGMSDVFFSELDLPPPGFHLGVGSGPHGAQTGRMLEVVEKAFLQVKPDVSLVYGDTNSTLAGALAAAKLHIPLAHVEAGLRSFNRQMPEEVNRVLTDHASDLLFVPTQAAVDNLRAEGITGDRVHLVGDVMYDASLLFGEKADRTSRVLDTVGAKPGEYVLATVHRAENTDTPGRLESILEGLCGVARSLPVVFPVHPRTRAAIESRGLAGKAAPLRLIDPVGYLDMIVLEKRARAIVTDSGGVQKEAFMYGVPCVTIRGETEWPETLEAGANRLVGADAGRIEQAVASAGENGAPRADARAFYGDGRASFKIAAALASGGGPSCGS